MFLCKSCRLEDSRALRNEKFCSSLVAGVSHIWRFLPVNVSLNFVEAENSNEFLITFSQDKLETCSATAELSIEYSQEISIFEEIHRHILHKYNLERKMSHHV